jgi:hypothetical protein
MGENKRESRRILGDLCVLSQCEGTQLRAGTMADDRWQMAECTVCIGVIAANVAGDHDE